MSDLVERLRDPEFFARTGRREELVAAADEIERLREQLVKSERLLRTARDFIDPDRSPPRTTNRELVAELNAALSDDVGKP